MRKEWDNSVSTFYCDEKSMESWVGRKKSHAVKLPIFTFLVPCCDVRYNFYVKTMFDSSLLSLFYRRFLFYLCNLYYMYPP